MSRFSAILTLVSTLVFYLTLLTLGVVYQNVGCFVVDAALVFLIGAGWLFSDTAEDRLILFSTALLLGAGLATGIMVSGVAT